MGLTKTLVKCIRSISREYMAVITVLENRATAVLEEYWEFSIICIELVRVHIFVLILTQKC